MDITIREAGAEGVYTAIAERPLTRRCVTSWPARTGSSQC